MFHNHIAQLEIIFTTYNSISPLFITLPSLRSLYFCKETQKRPSGKESTEVRITQKNMKRKGKLLLNNEEIFVGKSCTNTLTFI